MNTTKPSETLKPCPFCGAPLAIVPFSESCQQALHPRNGCMLSDLKVFPMGNGYQQWNTRAELSGRKELVEALKNLLANARGPSDLAASWCHDDYNAAMNQARAALKNAGERG